MAKEKEAWLTQNNLLKLLDALYQKTIDGIPHVIPPVAKLADDYLHRYHDVDKAADKLIRAQVIKCTTSGFLTGLGGLITLPLTVPANISSVLYVQMRMVGALAHMGGFSLKDDQVQSFVYACLAGVSVNAVVKKFGVRFGEKLAIKGIERIPGKVLSRINQRVAFRFITKFGEKGLVNLGKLVPVVGGAINGGFDLLETKIISKRAYRMFIQGDYTAQEGEEEILEADLSDSEEEWWGET